MFSQKAVGVTFLGRLHFRVIYCFANYEEHWLELNMKQTFRVGKKFVSSESCIYVLLNGSRVSRPQHCSILRKQYFLLWRKKKKKEK